MKRLEGQMWQDEDGKWRMDVAVHPSDKVKGSFVTGCFASPAEMQQAAREPLRLANQVERAMTKITDLRLERRLRRIHKPDGNCAHCERAADRLHPVGPLIVRISEP